MFAQFALHPLNLLSICSTLRGFFLYCSEYSEQGCHINCSQICDYLASFAGNSNGKKPDRHRSKIAMLTMFWRDFDFGRELQTGCLFTTPFLSLRVQNFCLEFRNCASIFVRFFFHLSYLHRRVVIVTLTSHILFAYSNHVLLYFILVRYGYISVPVRFDWYIHCIELLIYKFCTVASACFRYNTYNIYIYIFHSCDLWLNSFPDAGTHNMAANIDCFELNPVFVWGCENIHFMAPMWGTRGQGNWNLLVTEKTGDFVIIFY